LILNHPSLMDKVRNINKEGGEEKEVAALK
jgi:hypothetical protein